MYHLFLFILFIIAIYLVYYGTKRLVYPDCDSKKSTTHENIQSPIKVVVGSADDKPVQELRYFCIKDKGYHVSVWPKYQGFQGVDYIEFNIAGITHGEHVDEHIGEFMANLVPAPTNPYDANAIKIMTDNGNRVGYVPRDTTATIRDFTTIPCSCYCFIGNNDGIYFSDCYIKKLTNVSP